MGYGELYLGYSGNASLRLVIRVIVARVGERVDPVKLLPLERRHRGILDEHSVVVILDHSLALNRVGVFILNSKGVCIGALIFLHLVKVTALDGVKMHGVPSLCKIYAAAHVADLFYGNALIKKLCKSY